MLYVNKRDIIYLNIKNYNNIITRLFCNRTVNGYVITKYSYIIENTKCGK